MNTAQILGGFNMTILRKTAAAIIGKRCILSECIQAEIVGIIESEDIKEWKAHKLLAEKGHDNI